MPSLACPPTPLLEVIVCLESLLRKRSPTSSLFSARLTTYTCSSLWKIYFKRMVSFIFFRFPRIGTVLNVNKARQWFLVVLHSSNQNLAQKKHHEMSRKKSDTTATLKRAVATYMFVIYDCLHSNHLKRLILGKLRKYLWNHCGLTPTLHPGIDVSSNFKSAVTQCCKFLWNTFWKSLQQHLNTML